jgi:hypothetical protein
MWGVIPYITGGFALVAFIVAALAKADSRQLRQREFLINSVPANERAPLVEKTLILFNVDTKGLPKKTLEKIVFEQLKASREALRLKVTAALIVAFLATGLTALALLKFNARVEGQNNSNISLPMANAKDENTNSPTLPADAGLGVANRNHPRSNEQGERPISNRSQPGDKPANTNPSPVGARNDNELQKQMERGTGGNKNAKD